MIGIAFKDNGLVQYENQATVLNIKTENGYEDVYPQQIAEGVKLNSNTLKTNGRHIKLNGDTVAEAVEDLESRISLGGRKFEECNIPLTNYSKVKKVLYYHGAYYALIAHPFHDEFIYKSTDGLSWNVIYQNSDDNLILQDMAIFQNNIYIVVWKRTTQQTSIELYKFINESDLELIKLFAGEDINLEFLSSNIFIDGNDLFLVASASTKDKIIFFVAMQEQGQLIWRNGSTPREYNQEVSYVNNKLRLIFDTAHLIIGGYYYQLAISVGKPPGQSSYDILFGLKPIPVGMPPIYTSMSSYLPIQNDIRAIKSNNLISLTSNKDIMPFSEDLKYCYDEIYVNGKYIYNTLNEATGKSCCKYRWNESYRDVPYETTMVVMEQPLINLTYVGSYVFGVGYNDGKLYYSQVK